MALTCKQCGESVPAPAENQPWVRCANCQTVLNLNEAENTTALAQAGAALPRGMNLRLLSDGLQLTYNWFNPSYFGLALVSLGWTGFLLGGFSDFGWWLLATPHLWIGIGMGVVALTNLINRTTITVNSSALRIAHWPIPFPFSRRFDPILLKQLYVKEFRRQQKSKVVYTYDLYMATWSGRTHKVVSGIKEAHLALALEQEIERFLRIKDQPSPDEFRWLSDWESSRLRLDWKKLAATHSLDFDPGSSAEKATISGIYRGYNLSVNTFHNSELRCAGTRIALTLAAPPVDPTPHRRDDKKSGQPLSPQQILSRLASGGLPREETETIEVDAEAQKIHYEHTRAILNTQQLRQACDRMVALAEGYAELRAIGAEAIPALETLAAKPKHILNLAARQLMQDIAADTTARLGHQPDHFYCRRCLTRCAVHTGQITLIKQVTYYGCRTCRQSQALLEWAGPVVAVLDSGMTKAWVEQAGTVRVNWLRQRAPFDFESVEIVQASDEEIERFAVQVGNDTDPLRQPLYKQMTCRLGLTCHLSDNSLRVLRRIFGTVERGPLLADVVDTSANERSETIEDEDQSVSGSASAA